MNRNTTRSGGLRLLCLLLTLLLLFPCLVSCKTRALPASKLAKKEVGAVGDWAVTYEEFYFLCENHKDELTAARGEGSYTAEEVKALVWESIVELPILLQICRDAGLVYDEKELRDEVNNQISDQMLKSHNDDRKQYLAWLAECSMTDHYYRYFLGVNILYGKLLSAYVENGTLPSDDPGMMAYVKENFVNTRHAAFYFDESNRAEKLARVEGLLASYRKGEITMNKLIGRSEDIGLATAGSYYMAKGTMEPAYEKAVLSLEVGEVSGIVEAKGTDMSGRESNCFYIIERMDMKDSEITPKLDLLREDASDALAYQKYQAYKESLVFTPNEFCLSLDVMALETPKNGADPVAVWVPTGILIGVLVVAGVVLILFLGKRKKVDLTRGTVETVKGKSKPAALPQKTRTESNKKKK